MYVLNPTQLNNALKQILVVSNSKGAELSSIMILLYFYGLRINEVCNFRQNIMKVDDSFFYILTPKTGKIRKLAIQPITEDAINYLLQLNHDAKLYDDEKVQNFITRTIKVGTCVIGNKNATTHLFRHNYAKRQYALFRDIKEVSKLMAVSPDIAKRYVTSKIVASR